MNDVTTTKSGFPVHDITHKPKRMQGDMIRLKEAEMNATEGSDNTEETLTVVTLERAISHYKKMSSDAVNGKLYSATAGWLEELLVTRTLKTEAAAKAVIEKENSNEDSEDRQSSL